MSIPGYIKSSVESAEMALSSVTDENIELGFSLTSSALDIQVRKGCRMLSLSRELLSDKNSVGTHNYFTAIVELSFAAIERTIQAYLLEKGVISGEDFVDHELVVKSAITKGLFDDNVGEKIISLWKQYRSHMYYRTGVPSKEAAEAMLNLSMNIHKYVGNVVPAISVLCSCDLD